MCPQWCHRQRWIIDNDEPCSGCAYQKAQDLPATWQCTSCRWRQDVPTGESRCALTGEGLPARRACCHWDVLQTTPQLCSAPWVPFHDLSLDDLQLPLVFGVVAAEWSDALTGAHGEHSAPVDVSPTDPETLALLAVLEHIMQPDAVLLPLWREAEARCRLSTGVIAPHVTDLYAATLDLMNARMKEA